MILITNVTPIDLIKNLKNMHEVKMKGLVAWQTSSFGKRTLGFADLVLFGKQRKTFCLPQKQNKTNKKQTPPQSCSL